MNNKKEEGAFIKAALAPDFSLLTGSENAAGGPPPSQGQAFSTPIM